MIKKVEHGIAMALPYFAQNMTRVETHLNVGHCCTLAEKH